MHSTILSLAALVATAAAELGSGTIINACDYEVDLSNVPSADGVHTIYSTTLAPNGGSYSQQWTSLANNNGWSMKLNPSSDTAGSIMQFEYTYSDLAPDDLWFDLSYVNGAPFDKDWVISSNSASCVVKQTAYNDPTDDANGMQPLCSPDTDITVTLCSTKAGSASSAVSSAVSAVSSVADKVAAVVEPTTSSTEEAASTPTTTITTEEAASTPSSTKKAALTTLTTEAAPTTSSAETTSTTAAGSQAFSYLDSVSSTTSSPSPTTLATLTTSTSLATNHYGFVVTEVDTVVATDVVTVYGHRQHDKRHEHAHRHAHRHARR